MPPPDLLDGTPLGALRASSRTGNTQCAVLTPSDLFSVAAEEAQQSLPGGAADGPQSADAPEADASNSDDSSVRELVATNLNERSSPDLTAARPVPPQVSSSSRNAKAFASAASTVQ